MGTCCCIDSPKRLPIEQLDSKSGETRIKEREAREVQEEETKHRSTASQESLMVVIKNPPRMVKKREAVGVRQLEETLEIPSAVVLTREKTSEDKLLIASALQKHFIFTSLAEDQQDQVILEMKLYSLAAGQTVFEEGRPAVNFFVLASGRMQVSIQGRVVNRITPGNGFGELALLYDTPRTATIKAASDSTLWGLDRKTFKTFVERINSQQFAENQKFLDSLKVFEVLTRKQKDSLLQVMKSSKFMPGSRIVSQGEAGDVCFIIKEGVVSCLRDNREVRRLGKGELFGEQTLLYGGLRTATVVAVGVVKCVSIGSEDLQSVLGSHLLQVIYRNSLRIAFDRSESLRKLTKDQWEKLISTMKVNAYPNGRVVIPVGTRKAAAIWIVVKGELSKRSSSDVVATTFSVVGDAEFRSIEMYTDDILVTSDGADVAMISRREFEECIGGSLAVATVHNEALDVLAGIELLRGLSKEKLGTLIQALRLRNYSDGDVIVRQQESGDSFFIIQSGRVEVIRNGVTLRTITKLDYFGERSILFNEVRSATIVALGSVACWILDKGDFQRLIDQRIRKHLINRITLQDESIEIKDLVVIKTLGRGMFGVVLLVVHPDTRSLYAIKSVSRTKVQQYKLKQNMLLERNVLRQLDHSFIMKLIKTFKDESHMYFLTEYVRGMDFFDVLRKMDAVLTSEEARFYISCIMIILEHLHDRDIIYRDLKPENIMIDEDGYPKLIDFGTAKIVKGRTYTVIGTPHYMAPEVVVGKGYSLAADYWSAGVILYECMCGKMPYGDNDDDPYRIYERILQAKLEYPAWVKPSSIAAARPVIESLLSKNPPMRLGGSMENFKGHIWFKGLNWVRHS